MFLADAAPHEIAHVLSHTHALWGDGLSVPAYEEYIATLMASDWAREGRYRFLVARQAEAGPIAAALKLYRFRARVRNEPIEVGAVGAVFTLPEQRRRGAAAAMLERAHDLMRRRGDAASILFSEIGAPYYARLGYRELPGREISLETAAPSAAPRRDGETAAVSRFHRSDLELVERIREDRGAGESFDLPRDSTFWKYLLARASFPTLHLGREQWESRLMVARGAEAAAYLWGHFGARPEGAVGRIVDLAQTKVPGALPALLDDFFEECRKRGVAEARAWLSDEEMALDPRLSPPGARRVPSSAIPMWLPLDPAREPALAAALAGWRFQGVEIF